MKKNQNNNNNNQNSNLSSERSESSTNTLINDDDDEVKTSFEYLKDNKKEFFEHYKNIFDLDLKNFFNYIAFQEENILITIYFQIKFYYHLEMYLIFLIIITICIIFGLMRYLIVISVTSNHSK